MAPDGILSAFARDLALIFANCQAYNSEQSRIWEHAARLAAKASALLAAARAELGLPAGAEDALLEASGDEGGEGGGVSGHLGGAAVDEGGSEDDDDDEEFEEEDEEEGDDDGDGDFYA